MSPIAEAESGMTNSPENVAVVRFEPATGPLPVPRRPDKITDAETSAFTSAKLDRVNWILRDPDPRMTPSAKNTAIYLLQCVNSATLQCNPSYRTIADALGFKNEKTAERAVKAVMACGWIEIRRHNRTKSNRYVFLSNESRTKAIDEYQDHLRDRRAQEREEANWPVLEQTNMSGRTVADQTFEYRLEQTNMSGKHLKGTPEVEEGNEGKEPIKVISVPHHDEQHTPYAIPASEKEAISMLEGLFAGCELTPATIAYFRRKIFSGQLTPAMVEEHRRIA